MDAANAAERAGRNAGTASAADAESGRNETVATSRDAEDRAEASAAALSTGTCGVAAVPPRTPTAAENGPANDHNQPIIRAEQAHPPARLQTERPQQPALPLPPTILPPAFRTPVLPQPLPGVRTPNLIPSRTGLFCRRCGGYHEPDSSSDDYEPDQIAGPFRDEDIEELYQSLLEWHYGDTPFVHLGHGFGQRGRANYDPVILRGPTRRPTGQRRPGHRYYWGRCVDCGQWRRHLRGLSVEETGRRMGGGSW